MAGTNIRNKDHFGCTRSQILSPLRSYSDLSDYELDQVNSALEAAANFGQPETEDGDLKNLDNRNYDKEDREAEESSLETGSSESETSVAPKLLKRTSPFDFEPDEESESELSFGSSKSNSSDLFTITIDRKNRHRLETALKLLEFVEGGGNDSESDFSLNSFESSMFLDKVSGNNTTSTPRLQALKDRTRRDY